MASIGTNGVGVHPCTIVKIYEAISCNKELVEIGIRAGVGLSLVTLRLELVGVEPDDGPSPEPPPHLTLLQMKTGKSLLHPLVEILALKRE